MTWTYDNTQLAASELFQVRLLIKDTDTNRQLMQDEEINWLISSEPNIYFAAASAADTIAANFGAKASKTVGPLSISYGDQRDTYSSLADSLRTRGKRRGSGGGAIVLGSSKSEKAETRADPDREDTAARIGIHDNPGASYGADWRGV